MGAAKRRGTFEQRKAQRLAKQYGLTNKQLNEAYAMNRIITYRRFMASQPEAFGLLAQIMRGL